MKIFEINVEMTYVKSI